MFPKCEALPKRDLCDMLICRRDPFPPNSRYYFSQRHSTHEEIRESQSSLNIVRVDVWVVNQWWIRMIFRRKFMYPKFAVLARSKQHMPVTVKFRLEFLVCGLQGHLLWHLAKVGPMFVTKATKQWRIVEIEFLASMGRANGFTHIPQEIKNGKCLAWS